MANPRYRGSVDCLGGRKGKSPVLGFFTFFFTFTFCGKKIGHGNPRIYVERMA